MNHKLLTIILAFLACSAAAFMLFGCTKKPEPETDLEYETVAVSPVSISEEVSISRFSFSYFNPFGACGYIYRLEPGEKDGVVVFSYESDEYRMYETMTKELDASVLDKVMEIMTENKVGDWNGFQGSNPFVSDGDGFYLSLYLSDGTEISASGENRFPSGYHEVKSALDALFEPIAAELREDSRQAIIAQGINGKLDFIMINFKQQGASGHDSYNFFITQPDVRDNNFDVTIHSESGEFLPEGDYRYYSAVDVDQICFDKIDALIRKYELINWYNYDRTAEDYPNCEWFQIDFGFDNEFYLPAYGTEHPEHYDEFRHEFLQTLCDNIRDLENAGILEQYQ